MSIERSNIEKFFWQNPANASFAENVSWPEARNGRSPVRFMADILISEGKNGLATYGPAYHHAIYSREQNLAEIQRTQGPFLENSSAVYLGVALRAIEEILKYGEFDHVQFDAWLKDAFIGSLSDPHLIGDKDIEPIDIDKMKIITQFAAGDKTFADFFKRGFSALPEGLQLFLVHDGAITTMNSLVIPKYQSRAKLLTASINPSHNRR